MAAYIENVWGIKGASLGDKTAKEEYGLTQEEIRTAIDSGQLQYRINYVFENPYFKLIRKEVEELVAAKYGEPHLRLLKQKAELQQVEKELRSLKIQINKLDFRKTELQMRIKVAEDLQ
jgi:hypothetical protein